MLEISQNLFRQRIIEVIRHDERSARQPERSRSTDDFDGTNFGDGSITLGHDQRLPLDHSM
ncbi:MAG TPA: hypothetical protein VEZ11_03570, partial [Thermoanaerobaculia bacterium]|nr:hypothetical protein [Thermoanaerobaculia bacterium]